MTKQAVLTASALSLTFFFVATSARAEETKQPCIAAYEDGQRLQLSGDLTRAAEKFNTCSALTCSAGVRRECARLLTAAQRITPAIQFTVETPVAAAGSTVFVSIDGGEPQAYTGQILPVNPGRHRFFFECEGCASVSRRIQFSDEKLKQRNVKLTFACSDTDDDAAVNSSVAAATLSGSVVPVPPSPLESGAAESAPVPGVSAPARTAAPRAAGQNPLLAQRDALLLGTGAVAVMGGIGFVGFGLHARSAERDLASCAPYCAAARISSVKRDYVWANVSLGMGLIGLAGGGVVWLTSLPHPDSDKKARASTRQWALHVGPITTLAAFF